MAKIAFDVMGSDNGPSVAINSAIKSLKKYKDLSFVLYGDKNIINKELSKHRFDKNRVVVSHCSEYIAMTDGILDIRRKKDSSMLRALEAVRDNNCDGMITGSSSSSYVAGCHFILGEIENVARPGYMPVIPTIVKNKVTCFLDSGANLENSPTDLFNYGLMASAFMQANYNVEKPLVGLLNIGSEPKKGTDVLKETYELLENDSRINFFGNIEGREITSGIVDVIVCDGYAGNIALKSFEGMGKNLMGVIKKQIKANPWRIFFYLIGLRRAFKKVKQQFDYKNYAGAIMLGVDGIAFKSHGSSDEQCWNATIRMAREAIVNDVLNKMKNKIKG